MNNNIQSDTVRRLLKNPHYKAREDQVNLATQELRADDETVVAPMIKKQKRKKTKKSVNRVEVTTNDHTIS